MKITPRISLSLPPSITELPYSLCPLGSLRSPSSSLQPHFHLSIIRIPKQSTGRSNFNPSVPSNAEITAGLPFMTKNTLFSTILNYHGLSDRVNIFINPGLQNVYNTFQRIPILNLLELLYWISTRLKSSNISTFAF